MRKITLTLIVLISVICSLSAQDNYSKVRIMLNETGLKQIAELGIDVTEGQYKKGAFFITDLSEVVLNRLTTAGIQYKVIIQDVKTFYSQRAAADMPASISRDLNDDEWPVPENWEYGSMGGFYTLEEVMSELDDMATLYPDLISPRYIISEDTLTHEGRYTYWIRLSDNPEVDEDEPEILYTGVHHAREPMSVQQMIFYMWHLLENYAINPDIKLLVDNTEMYFVPVVNPDGYEWNRTTDPNGGGMWRKNRRDNGDGTHGVDPNRNYGYKWGYDNSGSSPITSEETYRGPSAFSEPEIKNMRDFTNSHEFKIALNYHSYSNLLLYPWGWTSMVTPDDDLLHYFAVMMTEENGYTIGPAATTIYPVNGDSNDWMYGEQETKDKIFAYVPEVGNSGDGFWPSTSRIIPLCQENMLQNIVAAQLVGKYANVEESTGLVTSNVEGEIIYDITRLGLTDAEEFIVSLTPLDDIIISTGGNDVYQNMNLMQTETDSISYTLDAGIENGTEFRFLLSVDNGMFTVSDTITKIFGTTVVIFIDDGEDFEKWTSTKWNITNEEYYSPLNSITDSKFSDYQSNQNNTISMDTNIDLTDVNMAFLSFWAKWDIEPAYDYVQILIQKEGESTWTVLSGNYTKTGGNNNITNDDPYYDGSSDWVNEEINISDFTGGKVSFRFKLVSDSYVEEDGFYFDDFVVSVISTATYIDDNSINNIFISNAYPNPTNDKFTISFNSGFVVEGGHLQLFNSIGSLVKELSFAGNNGSLIVDVNSLPDGIYYYNITISGKQSEVKKLIKIGR